MYARKRLQRFLSFLSFLILSSVHYFVSLHTANEKRNEDKLRNTICDPSGGRQALRHNPHPQGISH